MTFLSNLREWTRSAAQELNKPKTPGRRAAFLAARLSVVALVIYGISRHVVKVAEQIDWSLLEISFGWLGLSALGYLAALLALSVFYREVILDMGGRPQRGRAVSAFLVSQLGKYIPGKAMVIVIRAGMLRGRGVRASTAALATFFETPSYLGAGATIACVLLASGVGNGLPGRSALVWASGGMAALLVVLMSPWVFAWILRIVSVPFREEGEKPPAVSWRTRLILLPILLVVWGFVGASAIACVNAVSPEPLLPSQWPLLLAATALAMAAGFIVVVMPGGLGVREWVIMEVLAPTLGSEAAVFAAVGLRLIWLVVELVASGATYGWVEAWNRRDSRRQARN